MQRTKKAMLYLIFVIIALALLLCSCGEKKNPDVNPGGSQPGGQQNLERDGWIALSNIDNKDMYASFLYGFTSVAYDLSYDKVLNKQYSASGKIGLTLNGSDFYLSVKGKYDDKNKRDKAILSAELSTEETIKNDNRIFSAFVFKDKLYLAIGSSKVSFDISTLGWDEYYPYKMENYDKQKLSMIAGFLNTNMKLKTPPVGYHRTNSNKEEYKYSLDIDFATSMANVSKSIGDLTSNDTKLVTRIQSFIANILGISVEDVQSGNFPGGSVKMDFFTSGNNIQTLSLDMDVVLGETGKKLYGSNDLAIKVELKDFKINKDDYSMSIINDEIDDYTEYSKAVYDASIPIAIYNADGKKQSDDYDLRIITRVFQSDPANNFVFFEYYDTKKEIADRALYVYNNILYIVLYEDGEYVCKYTMPCDLSDTASRVLGNNLNGEAQADPFYIIAYVLKSLAMDKNGISFAINKEFFDKIWYNFSDLVSYLDSISPNHDFKSDEGTSEFITYLTTHEVILNVPFNASEIMKIVEINNVEVTDITNRIATFAQPNE